jgi:hypothetical protein
MEIRVLKIGEVLQRHDIYVGGAHKSANETELIGCKVPPNALYLRIEEPTSKSEETRSMQSGPAAQAISDSPHALNGVAPDCLSGLMSALRTYAEQSQPEMSVTMTLTKGELIINVKRS